MTGRMDWKVLHPEAAEELQVLGFVEPIFGDSEIFEVSEAGYGYSRAMRQ